MHHILSALMKIRGKKQGKIVLLGRVTVGVSMVGQKAVEVVSANIIPISLTPKGLSAFFFFSVSYMYSFSG